MYKKKHLVMTVLLIAILLMVVGCQKQPKEEKTTTETTDTEKKQETSEETTKKEEKALPYEAGVLSEAGFESKWMQLRYVPQENCVMATDEEMKQVMDAGMAEVQEQQGKEVALDTAGIAYEMMSLNALDNSNILIVTEKLQLSSITEEIYAETMKQGFAETHQIAEELVDATLGGQTFKMIDATTSVDGVPLRQEMYMKKIGSYMVIATISYAEGSEASRDAIVNGFQPY